MTVSISNLNFSWSNSSNIYTAIGANVNAASYNVASRLFSLKIDNRDIFFVDCNGVANIVNSLVIAGINVVPYIQSAANSANAYALSLSQSGDLSPANNWANTLYLQSLAYANNKANSANDYAVTVGAASNTWANTMAGGSGAPYSYANTIGNNSNSFATSIGTAGNNYTIQIGTASNTWANTIVGNLYPYANTIGNNSNSFSTSLYNLSLIYANGVANSANAYATSVGTAGNNYTISVGASSNAWANSITNTLYPYANGVANSANAYGDTTFLKLALGSLQTITGNIAVSGISLGSQVAASNTDLSKHISLYSSVYGFCITNGTLNYIVNIGAKHNFQLSGASKLIIDDSGLRLPNSTGIYINFGSVSGSTGYGFRDTSGDIEFKSNNGTWASIVGFYPYANGVANSANAYAVTIGAASNTWANNITNSLYPYANNRANSSNSFTVLAYNKANTINVRSPAMINISVSASAPTGNSVNDIWIDIS